MFLITLSKVGEGPHFHSKEAETQSGDLSSCVSRLAGGREAWSGGEGREGVQLKATRQRFPAPASGAVTVSHWGQVGGKEGWECLCTSHSWWCDSSLGAL